MDSNLLSSSFKLFLRKHKFSSFQIKRQLKKLSGENNDMDKNLNTDVVTYLNSITHTYKCLVCCKWFYRKKDNFKLKYDDFILEKNVSYESKAGICRKCNQTLYKYRRCPKCLYAIIDGKKLSRNDELNNPMPNVPSLRSFILGISCLECDCTE